MGKKTTPPRSKMYRLVCGEGWERRRRGKKKQLAREIWTWRPCPLRSCYLYVHSKIYCWYIFREEGCYFVSSVPLSTPTLNFATHLLTLAKSFKNMLPPPPQEQCSRPRKFFLSLSLSTCGIFGIKKREGAVAPTTAIQTVNIWQKEKRKGNKNRSTLGRSGGSIV